MRRPRKPNQEPFEIRHADHPLGADYDMDDNGCWIWKWSKSPSGYAHTKIKGKYVMIHRWVIRDSLTPDKPYALHKPGICHNRACINRDHLYAGTQKDNVLDKQLDDTAKYSLTNVKLTEEQVIDIYNRAWFGVDEQKNIAFEYGVHPAVVSKIKHGLRWNNITHHLR